MYYQIDEENETVDARDASPLMRNVRQVAIEFVEGASHEVGKRFAFHARDTFRAVFISDHERGQIAWNGAATRDALLECKAYCAARGIAILR